MGDQLPVSSPLPPPNQRTTEVLFRISLPVPKLPPHGNLPEKRVPPWGVWVGIVLSSAALLFKLLTHYGVL